MSKEDAIGVFDSGVGGLTVAGALTRHLPNERVIYLGDTARVPYGTESPEVVRKYAERCAQFLLTQNIKLLVVACNTATAHALPHLQATLPVPVVGVIEPGARKALTLGKKIGVIATQGTINSGAYRKAIEARDKGAEIFEVACPLFVPLAEEGWHEHDAARLIARDYFQPLQGRIDALVLGCTHYPILRKVIAETIGAGVMLCDSAEAVTQDVQEILQQKQLAASERRAEHRFFMTDIQAQFQAVAERFFGARVNNAERIDL